jgi:predicted nucleic acid-binding Zn ribbon protein
MFPCDNCGHKTDNIYLIEDGEKGLCSECAFALDEKE